MNLFRSEEHARKWDGFDESMVSALKPISEWAEIFSNEFFRQRGRPDYLSWMSTDEAQAAVEELRSRLPVPAE